MTAFKPFLIFEISANMKAFITLLRSASWGGENTKSQFYFQRIEGCIFNIEISWSNYIEIYKQQKRFRNSIKSIVSEEKKKSKNALTVM